MRRRIAIGVLAALFFVLFTTAAVPTAHADSRVFPTGYWGPLLSCTGNYIDPSATEGVSDHKVCTDVCDLLYTGQNVIDFSMTLVLFVGAPVMISFGGIMLLIAGGSGDGENNKRSMAKSIIVSAVVGVAITLGAYLILSTFLWLAGNNSDSDIRVSWPDIVCEVPDAATPAN